MALRLRRGTDQQRQLITPLEGELIYTTDTKRLYIGDGTTAGGIAVDTAGQFLGSNLDLSGYDIDGQGNINIDGNITATGNMTVDGNFTLGGNITVGDSNTDTVNFAAKIESSLIPDVDGARNVGSTTNRFGSVYSNFISVTDSIEAGYINANVVGNDSTVIVNVATGAITATGQLTGDVLATDNSLFFNATSKAVTAGAGVFTGAVSAPSFTGSLTGDVNGSIFGDDSTALVDAVRNTVTLNNGVVRFDGNQIELSGVDYMALGKETDVAGPTFRITNVDASPPLDLVTLAGTNIGNISKVNFSSKHGDIQNPVRATAGDFIGALSSRAWDPDVGDYVPSSIIGWTVDENTTPAQDIANGKILFINNAGSGSAPSLNVMSYDSRGYLAVNRTVGYVASATLDVNGFAKLTPQTAEPTASEGIIAIADGTSWDPASKAGAVSYPVYYDGNAWNAFY
jgi:cytoskeletal protein CcmA (bactofilin family)